MRLWQAGHSFQRSLGHSSPPDVYEFRGEQVEHLCEHVFHEFEGLLLSGAEHVLGNPPVGPYLVALAPASQLGIGSQRPEHMPGHVDLGNDLDVALCGVGHDGAYVVLGVKTAVGFSIVSVAAFVGLVVSADDGLPAYGPDLGQQGIAFDLDAPSLIFGEMPVKYVQLVHGEDVDETLHLVYGPEMTPGVEHSAAVCEAGFVADDDRGYCSVGSDELAECLQGVEHGLRGASENFDGTGRHGKSVLLGGEGRGCPETDFALRGHGYFAPDDGFDVRCEDFGGTPEFSFGGDGGLGRDPKLTSGFGDFRGARDDVDAPGGAGCREKCDED